MSKTVAGLKFITLILRKFSSASWSTRLDSLNPAQLWNCLHWFFIQNVYQQLFRYFYTIFHDTMVVLACLCQIKSDSTSITLSYIPQGVHIQSCVEKQAKMFSERCKLYQRVVILKNHHICLSYQIIVTLFIDGGQTQNEKSSIQARIKDKGVQKRKKMITLYLNFEELLLLIKFVYNRSNSLFLFHFLIVKSILITRTK